MGGRLIVRAAVATLMLAAACGGDDREAATQTTDLATSSSTTEAPTDWCADFSALLESGDVTAEARASAPTELKQPLEVLAGADDVDPEATGSLARLAGAYATVESWGHEQCGGDHPFCSLWITLSGTIAALAFSDDQEKAAADLRAFLDEIDDVLTEQVPPEVGTNLATFLASVRSPTLSDADERAAEAADDALEQWAYSEGCEGVSKPVPDD